MRSSNNAATQEREWERDSERTALPSQICISLSEAKWQESRWEDLMVTKSRSVRKKKNAKVMMMNVGLFVLTPLRGARKYQFVPGEELGLWIVSHYNELLLASDWLTRHHAMFWLADKCHIFPLPIFGDSSAGVTLQPGHQQPPHTWPEAREKEQGGSDFHAHPSWMGL